MGTPTHAPDRRPVNALRETAAPPASAADTAGSGPLSLKIGITGHRDLLREEDIPALEERIASVFAAFQERYPHTPLVLLSPIGEGADRLAARAALRCGVSLVVPLPMPREEYLRDFTTAESRAEFDELLQQADRWFELPLLPGNTLENLRDQDEQRAEQYGFVGAYIVRECQVLIALWSGNPWTQPGGTAQVVEFQLEGIPDRFAEAFRDTGASPSGHLDPMEGGLVYHIVTPRTSQAKVEGEPLSLHVCLPATGGEATHPHGSTDSHAPKAPDTPPASAGDATTDAVPVPESYDRIYRNIETYNVNALQIERTPPLQALRDQSQGYLIPDAEADTLPAPLQLLRRRYAVADTLAQHFQRLTLQTLVRLCCLVFTAALLFEISAKLFPNSDWFALTFPALLGVTYALWYTTVKRGKWQDRHQDYRALAEGLRVQFFWRLAGLPTSVADHYLRKQRGELDWIRIAVHNMSGEGVTPARVLGARCSVLGGADGSPASEPSTEHRAPITAFDLVVEHWVKNQARYFAKSAHRDHLELEFYEGWIRSLVVSSPILAALTALVPILLPSVGHWIHEHEKAHKLLIIGVFVLAGLAGVLHTYIDKRALSQHVKQYARMAALFSLAEHRLNRCLAAGRHAEAQQIVLDLGKEALAENGDWVLTHRERPVDVPHTG